MTCCGCSLNVQYITHVKNSIHASHFFLSPSRNSHEQTSFLQTLWATNLYIFLMSGSPSPRNRISPLPFADPRLSRNGSPLNPNSTPTEKPLPLPPSHSDDSLSAPSQSPHVRGRKISAVSDIGGAAMRAQNLDSSTLSLPVLFDTEGIRSTFRERSRSPGRLDDSTHDPEPSLLSSWWNEKHFSRPWHDSPKRKDTVPKEQTEAFESTRTVRSTLTLTSLPPNVL